MTQSLHHEYVGVVGDLDIDDLGVGIVPDVAAEVDLQASFLACLLTRLLWVLDLDVVAKVL